MFQYSEIIYQTSQTEGESEAVAEINLTLINPLSENRVFSATEHPVDL